MKTFSDNHDLAISAQLDFEPRLKAITDTKRFDIEISSSGLSEAAYYTIHLLDDDGDWIDGAEFCIRIASHPMKRSRSEVHYNINLDDYATDVYDKIDGQFLHIKVNENVIKAKLTKALRAAAKWMKWINK